MTDIERVIQIEHEIWNYPLVEETLYVTDCTKSYWTTINSNVLWDYYEATKDYR